MRARRVPPHLRSRNIVVGALLAAMTALVLVACDDPQEPPLARVGDQPISGNAFRQRYAILLRKTSMRDNLLARQQVLQTLIDEEVLLAAARQLGISQESSFREEVEAIEQQVLLDQYRKIQVFASVEVTEEELRQTYARLNTRVTARHLFAPTKEEAEHLRDLLNAGVSFEELAASTFRDPELAANGGLVGSFTLGEMDPAFEEVAFSLPIGVISEPVKTRHGYSIIRVEDRIQQPLLSEWEFQRRKKKIAGYVRWVKSLRQAQRFTEEVAQRLDIRFHEAALRAMAERITAAADSLTTPSPEEPVAYGSTDPLAEIADEPLVTFHGGAWTVGEFLARAKWTSERQQQRVTSISDLREFVRGLVVRHYLLEDARRLGVHRRRDTREEIARQVRDLTLRRMRQALETAVTVPDSALRRHYETHRQRYVEPEQVNVREIMVESQERAMALLDQIRAGADFSELARRHSLRRWAAARGGELGYAPAGRYGHFAEPVFAARIGDLLGPYRVGEAYSILEVLGRRPARQKAFAEVRQQVEQELQWEWQQRAVREYVEAKREELGVVVDADALASLSLGERRKRPAVGREAD